MPMGKKKRSPKPANASRREFSAGLLRLLNRSRIPYRVGGTYAMNVYLGMDRKTKDVDIFCHPGDYPRILKVAEAARYRVEVEDELWIAKIRRGRHFCDVVFVSANGAAQITDQWFTENVTATISSVHVKLLPPTEMIWSKVFILDRIKCDVNDVAHLILRQGERVDWKRPVLAGDVLTGTSTVVERRISASRAKIGILTVENELFNQDGLLVCRTRQPVFVRVKNPGEAV